MTKFIFFFILFIKILIGQDTVRVVSYNILNYDGTDRSRHLRLVTSQLNADVLVVQEMISQSGVDSFKISVLENKYETIPFINGTDTDNHVFYNNNKFSFIGDGYISTSLRNVAIYILRLKSTNELIYFFSAHLKASSGEDNEARRLEEATSIRNYLNQLQSTTNYMLLGDLNLYYSGEPAYQKLIEEDEYNGRLYDPIDTPGSWHNNFSYTNIHTQSTRTQELPDGGSTGGLDDRFDFILISETLLDNFFSGSYTAFGNDGNHFNVSINNGVNSSVSNDVADALFYASDHLPVICEFIFETATSLDTPEIHNPKIFKLYPNFPNPFNGQTTLNFYLPQKGMVKIKLFNAAGSFIKTLSDADMPAGKNTIAINLNNLASGIYYYNLEYLNRLSATGKLLLLK